MDNNNETINLTQEMLQSLISTAVIAATTALGQNVSDSSGSHSKAEKPKRPIISSGTTMEKWSYFTTKWDRYKKLTGIKNDELSNQLLECCDEDLQLALHRAVGSNT